MGRYERTPHSAQGAYGYYSISVKPQQLSVLLRSNNERAFIVSQLQDLLSPRLSLDDIPAHRQLASCIDLLSFSITKRSIQLVLFCIDVAIAKYFTNCIIGRLEQYRGDTQYTLKPPAHIDTPSITVIKLAGPHQALARSLSLHLLHEDWEYDRYSSTGFYLHDRRGDWMRTWRLAQLYNNEPSLYHTMLHERIQKGVVEKETTPVARP